MAIYLSRVIGLPVVYTRLARQAGVVGQVQVDLVLGRVVALDVDHMDGYLSERVPVNLVTRLGPRIVVVAESPDVALAAPVESNERWVSSRALIGMPVITEDGDHLGFVKDVVVERDSLAITHYDLRQKLPWLRSTRLRPGEVVASGKDLIISRSRSRAPTLAPGLAMESGAQALGRKASANTQE